MVYRAGTARLDSHCSHFLCAQLLAINNSHAVDSLFSSQPSLVSATMHSRTKLAVGIAIAAPLRCPGYEFCDFQHAFLIGLDSLLEEGTALYKRSS